MVRTTALLSAAALATATTAFGGQQNTGSVKETVPGAYIFEFEQGHDTQPVMNLLKEEATTRMNLDFELFKGVSVQLNDVKSAEEKAKKLAELPAVKQYWPVVVIPRPNPKIEWVATDEIIAKAEALAARGEGPAPDTFAPHVMTQVDKLRAKGFRGKGTKIAVVDTGIDYTHPALGNKCFGKGCLVSFGTDLVGDDYNGRNTPKPDNDPMDCGGHGTHVAGIIAAQPNPFGFTGAAPDVTLGAYKVFGCTGSVGNDVLIAAFNKAYQDGANIITSSIGGPSGWSEDAWSVAASRIVEKGVPVTISAGNEGATGIYFASTAAQGKRVTAIASFDNTMTPTLFTINSYAVDGGAKKDFRLVSGDPSTFQIDLPLYALTYDTTIVDDGCKALPDSTPDLGNSIVLVRRGSCAFTVKAANVAAKGAKYIIFYNNQPTGALGPDVTASPTIKGTGMVEAATGASWVADLKAGKKITIQIGDLKLAPKSVDFIQNNATGGALSGYTTWGPTWENDLKPQYGGPGGNILSTYPVAKGSYAVESGTSMSCPIVAAITALVAEVRGTYDPETLQALLSANANPQLFNVNGKYSNILAPVPQQGAGLVQAADAAFATTLLTPSSFSFNDTAHFVKSTQIKLSNTGKSAVTYSLSHVPALTVYSFTSGSPYIDPFPNAGVDATATLEISQTKVTINPGQSKSIKISPTPPQGLDPARLGVWSGYVAVNGTDGTSLSWPYQGVTGSLYEHTVLVKDDTLISDSLDKDNKPVPANTTFTIPAPGNAQETDRVPAFVINLALGTRLMTGHLVPMTTCPPKTMTFEFKGDKTIGQPDGFPSLYNPRGVAKFSFTGKLSDGNYAPPGKYKLVVRALRVFGDEKKEKDWDVSTTPAFRIKYA